MTKPSKPAVAGKMNLKAERERNRNFREAVAGAKQSDNEKRYRKALGMISRRGTVSKANGYFCQFENCYGNSFGRKKNGEKIFHSSNCPIAIARKALKR